METFKFIPTLFRSSGNFPVHPDTLHIIWIFCIVSGHFPKCPEILHLVAKTFRIRKNFPVSIADALTGFFWLCTSCGGRKVKILQTDIYANPSLSPSRGLGCKSKLCAIKLANCTPVGYITNVRATETSKALSDLLLNPNGVMGCLGMAKLFTPLPFNYTGIRRSAIINHIECDIYVKFSG